MHFCWIHELIMRNLKCSWTCFIIMTYPSVSINRLLEVLFVFVFVIIGSCLKIKKNVLLVCNHCLIKIFCLLHIFILMRIISFFFWSFLCCFFFFWVCKWITNLLFVWLSNGLYKSYGYPVLRVLRDSRKKFYLENKDSFRQ